MEIKHKNESFNICQRCGKNAESHSNYCIYCGNKLSLADKPVQMNNDKESVITQYPSKIPKKPDRTITVFIAGLWPLALTILLGSLGYATYMGSRYEGAYSFILILFCIWSLSYFVIVCWRWSKGSTLLDSSLIALAFATLITVALSVCFIVFIAYLLRDWPV
jgi:hypothetical protein